MDRSISGADEGSPMRPMTRSSADTAESFLSRRGGRRRIDLTGLRVGRLIVLHRVGDWLPRGHTLWACQCDCGGTKTSSALSLRRGHTRSCGCITREQLAAFNAPKIDEFNGLCDSLVESAGRVKVPARRLFDAVRDDWGD